MRTMGKTLLAAAVVIAGSLPVSATTLFSNPFDRVRGGSCTFECRDAIGAENFTLTDNSLIETVSFDAYLSNWANPIGMTVSWSLMSDDGAKPGSVLASGTAAPTHQKRGQVPDNFTHVTFTLDIVDTLLGAGEYWLTLAVDTPMADHAVYWARTRSGDMINSRSMDGGATWDQRYARSWGGFVFSVDGQSGVAPATTAAAVPLPAALPMLGLGVGVLAAAGARRRRRRA